MNELRTSRIVVIDDNPLEAMPVLRALGRAGLGAVYVNGEVDDLPSNAIEGVRLVFVDLNLDVEGEPKAVLAKTLHVLEKVVGTRANPLVIILWTKHDDWVQRFTREMLKQLPGVLPGVVLAVQKRFNFEGQAIPATRYSSRSILKSVQKRLSIAPSLRSLWHLEQCVHEAASRTTSRLSEIAVSGKSPAAPTEPALRWESEMREVLAALVAATGRREGGAYVSALSALLNALGPLIQDRIEYAARPSTAVLNRIRSVSDLAKEEEDLNRQRPGRSLLSDGQRASLSTMLLVGRGGNGAVGPGSVFLKRLWSSTQPFPVGRQSSCVATHAGLLKETLHVGEERARLRRAQRQTAPFMVEFTPPCDFAQNKSPMKRYLLGLLVPLKSGFRLRDKDAVFRLGVVHLAEPDWLAKLGPVHVVVNYGFVVGLSRRATSGQHSPLRIRGEALHALTAGFSSHASRPGMFTLPSQKDHCAPTSPPVAAGH